MAQHVVNGASTMCTFGSAPATLVVLPTKMITSSNQPAATIMDHKPLVNILPFGPCKSLAFPATAAATAAASGVLTPMPCIPLTTSPWVPGSPTVMLGGEPALNNTSKCMCNWGGVISITVPGQVTEMIP